MEHTQDHLIADATSAQKVTSQDEGANPEWDFKPTSSPIQAFSNPENRSSGEGSQASQQAIPGLMFCKNQHQDQDLTQKLTDQGADPQMAMDTSSISCSEIPDTLLQSNLVGENIRMNEKPEENDSALLFQKSPPTVKDGIPRYQPSDALSTDYVLGSAENLLQLSEITIPPTPPATALAPSLEPTAAICDGSLGTSQIEISVDAATIVSGHVCDSQMPQSDAGKSHPSRVFLGPQSSSLGDHGNELTLDELVQGSNHVEDDRKPAITGDELPSFNKTSYPDESLLATSGVQEIDTPVRGLVQEGANDMGPEFELDSSPIESSSSDTSSDQSSSDDVDDDDDYEMLDPAEQAARLMQEDIGSDDEGMGRGNNGAGAGPPRTLNEKPDEVVPKPDLIITEKMKIEELGHVENLVENLVLIKAKTSGEYQVLEFGSVLCLENRIVIGVVAETLGRVEQPYYAVHFTNERAIAEAGISKGTKIFYVEQHSTYVFTPPLQKLKGSDASNLHDEEVGDEGIEFSDDEAEAEYKRKLKLAKQAKRDIREGSKDRSSRGGRQRGDKMQKRRGQNHPGHNGSSRIDYDDPEGGDDLYTPLARPLNLHEIMGRSEAPLENQNLHRWADRGGRGGRGKGDRGRGDRGRGNRGYGSNRSNPGDNSRMASERKNHAQASGGDVGLHSGGTEFHQLPSSNGFLPPRPAPTDGAFPYYAAAGQPQIGPPTPSIHQPSSQHSARRSHYDQSNNAYNQPYTQPSFYAPASQTPYNPSQSHPPYYQHQPPPQAQPPLYFPPPPHHQPPMPYPQYHPNPSSPSTPNVPAGTFINPAFFPSPAHSTFPPWPQVNPTQQASASASTGNSHMSPESERAFHAINILRNLSSGDGSHPHPT